MEFNPRKSEKLMLHFSRRKFESNASVSIRRALKSHLDALDGLPVNSSADAKYGVIEHYEAEGKDWCLYPVYPEWCEEAKQNG